MNIALSAIILILILLPGTTAISAYYGSLTRKASGVHIPFNELLTKGLVLSVLIHFIGIYFIRLMGFTPNIFALYQVVTGGVTVADEAIFLQDALFFLGYSLSLVGITFGVSKVFKQFVQRNDFDLRFHSLRTASYWFHMFGGRTLDENGNTRSMVEMDFVYVDILTQSQFLYSGRLYDFNYSPFKDELENIILANAQKRHINSEKTILDEDHLSEPKSLPGDALVVKASTILNINIIYVKVAID